MRFLFHAEELPHWVTPRIEPSRKWSTLLAGEQRRMFTPGPCCQILSGHDLFFNGKKTLSTTRDLVERRGSENLLEFVTCRSMNDGRRSTTGATHTFYKTIIVAFILIDITC